VKSSSAFLFALGLLLALASPTMAREDRIQVNIKSLDNGKAEYKGKIRSDIPECVENRIVKVYDKDSRLVKTETDSDGKFLAVGKQLRSGRKLTVKVPAEGDCPKMIGTGTAE
jgi:hypothetical protein